MSLIGHQNARWPKHALATLQPTYCNGSVAEAPVCTGARARSLHVHLVLRLPHMQAAGAPMACCQPSAVRDRLPQCCSWPPASRWHWHTTRWVYARVLRTPYLPAAPGPQAGVLPLQVVQPGRWLAVADETGTLRVLEPSNSDQPPAAAVVAAWGVHSNSIFDVAWAKVGQACSCWGPSHSPGGTAAQQLEPHSRPRTT
jgi:hypothetical protein